MKLEHGTPMDIEGESMRIIREEGFFVDAMSPGEIFLEEQAGFTPSEIFMVTNNISDEEIRFAADRNGVGRGPSASVAGLAASVIGMAVCLVHCLPTVADAVFLFVGAV